MWLTAIFARVGKEELFHVTLKSHQSLPWKALPHSTCKESCINPVFCSVLCCFLLLILVEAAILLDFP